MDPRNNHLRVDVDVDVGKYHKLKVRLLDNEISPRRIDLNITRLIQNEIKPLTPKPRKLPAAVLPDVAGYCQRRRIRSVDVEDKIQSTNKMPPNWSKHLKETLRDKLTYRTFTVSSTSTEYSTICNLIYPLRVLSVEQIVNPTLYDKFDQKRKDMIKSKCDDVTTLSDIGLSRNEMKNVLQYSKDFPIHKTVASVPYNVNMSLLFHCTRNKENIEGILKTGLDERIGNGGLLGRGIYFTDNPKKSTMYDSCNTIFIFGVLLGDCLSMDKNKVRDLVREPEKVGIQKRNFNDLFFDSICGRPMTDNEFVIYNRHQSIPLYKIRYEDRLTDNNRYDDVGSKAYVGARVEPPPFCWQSSKPSSDPMPSLTLLKKTNWPFYSNTIFGKMGVL